DGYTKRTEVKTLLQDIYQRYPSAKGNFLYMLENREQVDLWRDEPIDEAIAIDE
ncbi:MAG: hypothetical protein HFE67_02825, partial [Erysipelotrichaceae bacterium]|nr:hypothetical protein [Erysipelotrichaceae bacterium]